MVELSPRSSLLLAGGRPTRCDQAIRHNPRIWQISWYSRDLADQGVKVEHVHMGRLLYGIYDGLGRR